MLANPFLPSLVHANTVGYLPILTCLLLYAQVGLGWGAAVGSGLVVVRQDNGEWSPPSALMVASLGWGLQAGGALHDHLIVLRNE